MGLLIACLMIWLGPIQLIWAIYHLLFTRYSSIRRHFAYYFLGVLVYLFLLVLVSSISESSKEGTLFMIHFFGGAWTLAIYHVWIVCKSVSLLRNKIPADLRQKANDYELNNSVVPQSHGPSTTSPQ